MEHIMYTKSVIYIKKTRLAKLHMLTEMVDAVKKLCS